MYPLSIKQKQNKIKTKNNIIIKYETNRMEPPELYKKTLQQFIQDQSFIKKQNYILHKNSDKIAVIIDPRFDDMMEAVIHNFMYYMNPKGWNIQIISYSKYIDTIKTKFPNAFTVPILDELIFFNEYGEPNITQDVYNRILLDVDFWKSFSEKNICIFQKDCIMFHMFKDYFMEYDYSGANYYNKKHISFYYGGINGGFSIRKRDTMIECLQKISWNSIIEYRKECLLKLNNEIHMTHILDNNNEDIFFTYACEMLYKLVPDKIHRSFLSIEADINTDTSVFHGWQYKYHSLEIAYTLLRNSELLSKYVV